MKRIVLWMGGLSVIVCLAGTISLGGAERVDDRKGLEKLHREGNYQEALTGFRRRCLDPDTEPATVATDVGVAVDCLARLGRIHEVDDLLEGTVKAHPRNWRLLHAVAQQYSSLPHQGFLIAGEFRRGGHRGGGKMVFAAERDRVRALQRMVQAMPLVRLEDRKNQVSSFYLSLARMLQQTTRGPSAWRLQSLTELDELPDYEDPSPYGGSPQGAPVDAEGNPVLHAAPRTWDDAQTDGQRWRWALNEAVENSPGVLNQVRWQLAQFHYQQFGVQTMSHGTFFPASVPEDDNEEASGTYALHTLGENETICRLATGIKRFSLPDEFNFIRIFQAIAEEPQTGHGEDALNALAELFENRRQYETAADDWRRSIDLYGKGHDQWKQKRLDQIVQNWGRFEAQMTEPAGQDTTVEFVFRNATKVEFVAHEIDVPKLLDDVKTYLKSNSGRIDGRKIQIENLGWRLVQANERQYLKSRVATWVETLKPRKHHFDRRVTITTPLKEAGAYLLTARVQGGNASKIVVWVSDTAMVQKQLAPNSYYFVADAVTGAPIAKANVEFFGYRQERQNRGQNRGPYRIITTNFAERTDANGQVQLEMKPNAPRNFQWLVTARTPGGRFAYLGFRRVWGGEFHDAEYNQVKTFCITDRPVYRPGQTTHFKFWVRHTQYDKDDVSQFAGQLFTVELYDPKGEKVENWQIKADEYGGIEGEHPLPEEATLGQYRFQVVGHAGGGFFRVEEYKKPEFEVLVDAPEKPVTLGETITATITAKYYFGSPVTDATVKYKILRSDHSQDWYPIAPWDWFYGPGYWWFGYDTPWYPGWRNWAGCFRPIGWWWPQRHDPPEVVAEREVEIGEDGIVEVEIDTALAKELHGDTDHEYSITAEVRDQSRRTIVGQGKVLVARKPFKVFTWLDRGYYRVGETIRANFLAQTLDNKPVPGSGVLTLYKISYDEKNEPVETPMQRWPLHTGDDGKAQLPLQASSKGQYRLSFKVTDVSEHTIEGGYLFTVIGDGFDGGEYRFNSLELIPNQREYAPGERVQLQINTDRVGSTVLLFVRPANGVYLPPQVLRLDGKSTVKEVAVVKKDMPNFFVEAVTIADGKVHSEIKEIVVPPEERVLDVEVVPSAETYKPGEKAQVKLHLTEWNGENFVGSTVLSIYDKSVEYISGGSNVGDIREFFWKWRRHHHLNQQTTLDRRTNNITLPGKEGMSAIGRFGHTVADEEEAKGEFHKGVVFRSRSSGMGGFGGGGGGMGGQRMMASEARMKLGMAMDAAAPAAAEGEAGSFGGAVENSFDDGIAGGPDLVAPTVRSEFADTALWVGSLATDEDGFAEVSLDMPENLTTWKVKVWGMGHGTKVGSGDAEVVTRKNLILRLQTPRFLVQNDQAVFSANIHNYLDDAKEVRAVLELPGEEIESLDPTTVTVRVDANGEKRVDWRVRALREGEVIVRMKALTDEESDAVQVEMPCYVHGMLKTESWAGTV
ncbi:MAG: MG2 domain-containing protein, partial [Pirellulaceae bacterium]